MPKSQPLRHGTSDDKIASDMKGTDVFQQIHSPGTAADGPKAQNESRE